MDFLTRESVSAIKYHQPIKNLPTFVIIRSLVRIYEIKSAMRKNPSGKSIS